MWQTPLFKVYVTQWQPFSAPAQGNLNPQTVQEKLQVTIPIKIPITPQFQFMAYSHRQFPLRKAAGHGGSSHRCAWYPIDHSATLQVIFQMVVKRRHKKYCYDKRRYKKYCRIKSRLDILCSDGVTQRTFVCQQQRKGKNYISSKIFKIFLIFERKERYSTYL